MILALDTSLSNTGWAVGADGVEAFGSQSFEEFRHDYALVGREFRSWLGSMFKQYNPTDLAIERPFLRNEGTSYLLGGIVWEAHRAAQLANIPRHEYAPSQVKAFFGASGKNKVPMIEAAQIRGYKPNNDDEADAIALLLLHQSRATR